MSAEKLEQIRRQIRHVATSETTAPKKKVISEKELWERAQAVRENFNFEDFKTPDSLSAK